MAVIGVSACSAPEGLGGINDEKLLAVRTVAERVLRGDAGLLRHINVAHLDELSGQNSTISRSASCLISMTGRKGWINIIVNSIPAAICVRG